MSLRLPDPLDRLGETGRDWERLGETGRDCKRLGETGRDWVLRKALTYWERKTVRGLNTLEHKVTNRNRLKQTGTEFIFDVCILHLLLLFQFYYSKVVLSEMPSFWKLSLGYIPWVSAVWTCFPQFLVKSSLTSWFTPSGRNISMLQYLSFNLTQYLQCTICSI